MITRKQLSRRDMLSLGAVASMAPWVGAAHADDEETNYIDAHVHIWTPDTVKYPLASGFTRQEMKPASFTPEELFVHSRPAGVDRIVLIQMSYYGDDNRYMLDMLAKSPEIFRAVAVVDENRPHLRDTMLKLSGDGVRGFRLMATQKTCMAWETSTGMETMWSVGAEADLKMCLLANPDALPAIANMCRKHPQTPVVIDHMARIGMTGKIEPTDVENLCRLAEFKNVYVKTSAFYALGAKKPPYTDLGPLIRRLRDTFGAQRLMWASDCPFQVENGHTYAASINLIHNHLDFLTKADRRWMLRDTAEKVFFS